MDKEINQEMDTTRFVNIDDEPLDIYIGGKLVRHLEKDEENILVVYVAQVGAKHLIDRILQKKGVKDSLRDTPERKSLFARILPDMAVEIDVKPQTKEEFEDAIMKRLEEQAILIRSLSQGEEDKGEKEKEVESLRKELDELKASIEEKVSEKPESATPKKQDKSSKVA